MKEIIGERQFDLHLENGDQDVVKALIYKPYQAVDDPDTWTCEWEVQKPGKSVRRYAHGTDSLQALIIGIEMLRLEVESSALDYKGGLTLFGQDRLWL